MKIADVFYKLQLVNGYAIPHYAIRTLLHNDILCYLDKHNNRVPILSQLLCVDRNRNCSEWFQQFRNIVGGLVSSIHVNFRAIFMSLCVIFIVHVNTLDH